MNGAEVDAAMRERYSPPEWAIFFEVANATGGNARRRADAVAMSLWPSRGLELNGFEIKVSRSDWIREKDNPEKAEAVYKFMDRWWLVVGDAAIVQPGELPPTWGLLVPRGKALVAKVEAPKLEPAPVSRSFLAALLRRADEHAHAASREGIEAAREDARKASYIYAESSAKQKYEGPLERLRETVRNFEEASGVRLEDNWRAGKIGDAVKRTLARDSLDAPDRLRKIGERAKRLAADVEAALAPDEVPNAP